MPKSPVPLQVILDYLRLEDVEGLVPGSVRYVGHAVENQQTRHYWSYPSGGQLAWACWDGSTLGDADCVPEFIRACTQQLGEHRVRRPAPAPKRAWAGSNLAADALPRWVPASQVQLLDADYVAAFPCDFSRALRVFGATASRDKYNGGAGSCRYFLLEIQRSRLAMLECEDRYPDHLRLYLPVRQGTAYWDDYDQVVNPLGVLLENSFRQGGIKWKYRKPTAEALESKRNHGQRMWIPPNS